MRNFYVLQSHNTKEGFVISYKYRLLLSQKSGYYFADIHKSLYELGWENALAPLKGELARRSRD